MTTSNTRTLNTVLHIENVEERLEHWRVVMGGVLREDTLYHVSHIHNDHPVISSTQTRITVYHDSNMGNLFVKNLRRRTFWCCPHCRIELFGAARCRQHIQGVHQGYRPFHCSENGCDRAFGSRHGLEQVRTLFLGILRLM